MSENTLMHTYYLLSFKLLSPMLIGCGKSENTDNDVLLGSDKQPYIPATSMVGVLRRSGHKTDAKGALDTSEADTVFGLDMESPVIMSDAVTKCKTYVSERDNVALDEYKVAKEKAKFNYEVVQPGVVFTAIAEITADNAAVVTDFEKLLAKADNDGLAFGAKTERGLGEVELKVWKKEFDLFSEEGLNSWLEFNPFAANAFDTKKNPMVLICNDPSSRLKIELEFKQAGGLSIRYYTGEIGEENDAAVKNSPLLVRAEAEEGETLDGNAYVSDSMTPPDSSLPVVPGTSWAGAFRRRFIELIGDDVEKLVDDFKEERVDAELEKRSEGEKLADEVFGFVYEKKKGGGNSTADEVAPNEAEENAAAEADSENAEKTKAKENPTQAKSKIKISETVLHKGKPKTLTRIAVDRFSGAVKNHALLTEQSVFYGHGKLVLRIDRQISEKTACALCAVLCDLNNGYLAVGGETAIGRGMFKITEMKVDGVKLADIEACSKIIKNNDLPEICFETMKTAVLNGLGKGAAANDA